MNKQDLIEAILANKEAGIESKAVLLYQRNRNKGNLTDIG